MELYLIRHADMTGDPHCEYQPPVEGCLSETGVRQAGALGRALAEVEFSAVYASPLGRAVQTAQVLRGADGVSISILPWLTEWRPATVIDGCDDTKYEQMLEAASKLRPEKCWKTPAGEGTLEMYHRIVPGFLTLMASHGVHAGHGGYLLDDPEDAQRVVLVAHGGSLGVLTAFLLGIPIRPFAPIAYAQTGVAVFGFVRRVDVWYPMMKVPVPYASV